MLFRKLVLFFIFIQQFLTQIGAEFEGFEMDSGALKDVIWNILLHLLLFNFSVASIPWHRVDDPIDPLAVYRQGRFPEVKHHCAPFLPVLAELKPDDTRGERIKNELGFVNGDWSQEPDAMPLISAGKKEQNDMSNFGPSTKLVSFWVIGVDSYRPSDNMVSVSGILEIGFSRHQLFSRKPYKWSPNFETDSEISKLTITFEGVYVETDENGGERHMCLLGTSLIPDSAVSLNNVLRDDKIMLKLRYPKSFTLTSRGIYGEMESLAADLQYFGAVSISSQLNTRTSWYQFHSEQMSKACSPYKESDILFHGSSVIFQGKDFCNYLQGISKVAEFKIYPNHKSFVQDGLFGSYATHNQHLNFGNMKLVMRNFICHPGFHGISSANVSAEFTVFSDESLLNGPSPRETSGLSDKSIFAEGVWSSSEKELCMVGCLGCMHKNSMKCDYRLSVFFPTAFSIHRRSMVYGSITSITAQQLISDVTVSFEFESVVSNPNEILQSSKYKLAYDYSKISFANAFKSRHQLAPLVMALRKTVLEYPSYDKYEDLLWLSFDLTVRAAAVVYSPEYFVVCKCSEELEARKDVFVDLYIEDRDVRLSTPAENQDYSEMRTVLVEGYLSIIGKCFNNVSLSVEGLYDPGVGTMHLMGCKDLRALPIENTESLEQGQDCMIEVEVVYPPMNVRWLLKQKLKISVSSQREKQDPLYFSPIVVWTSSITYPWQLSEKEFIRIYEAWITIILLIVALYSIAFQLMYMRNGEGEAGSSYISLVMLGIQCSSYLFPFITGSDMAIISTDGNDSINAVFGGFLFIRALIVAYFFRLARNVGASRRGKPNSANDVKVLIITLSVHALGLHIFCILSISDLGKSIPLEQYWGLVLDLFLLPQIIANKLWRIRSKPLRKIYYIGLSLVRALPHLHIYYCDPVPKHVAARVYQGAQNLACSNRLSDLVIAITVILLALVVYIQQRRCIGSRPEPSGRTESL